VRTWEEKEVFDRFISIDWSGAGTETDRVDVRVVEVFPQNQGGRIVYPIVERAAKVTRP
jgi:hypothetical protein